MYFVFILLKTEFLKLTYKVFFFFRLKAYVESYEMLEERIREYKDKIRELENQKCQDDTSK